MHRSKLIAALAVLLAGLTMPVWCQGEEVKRPLKKKPGPPAAVKPAAKANSPANPGALKPAGVKPAGTAGALAASPAGKTEPGANKPLDLGGNNEGKTINFTSGKPVITNTPEDKVAINSALKEFSEASKGVTFGASRKKSEPPKN